MNDSHRNRHLLFSSIALVILLAAACSSSSASQPIDAAASSPAASSGAGSGSAGSSGSGGLGDPVGSVPGNPNGGGNVIDPGKPTFVLPKPGQLDPHPVSIEDLSARVEGHRVLVTATWWSGVEPCYVLDSAAVKIDGKTITVSVREGTGARDQPCIEIAVHKVTIIDLGELAPGTYTIAADKGEADPVEVTVNP
jgi:ABC-type transport system substrate-binding protein